MNFQAPERKPFLSDRDYVGHADHHGARAVRQGVQCQLTDFWQALYGCRPYLVLFLLVLVLPTYTSFSVGPLRLTLYRLYLLVALLPCVFRLVTGCVKFLPSDPLLLVGSLWAAVALIYHHGMGEGLEAGGIFFVESFGAYLLGRTLVRCEKDYQSLVALLVLTVSVMLPFTLIEALTGNNLFGQPPTNMGARLGMERARGTFDHPIVFGIVVATVFGMNWFCFPPTEKPIGVGRLGRSCSILASVITSVSGGPLTALSVQVGLVAWSYLTASFRYRWLTFVALLASAYVLIDVLSNRTPMRVFLTYLTFSSHTAYNRLFIWEWGFYENVLKHPMMGIGMTEWVRPSWMRSTSMDNFWLVLMVRHGLPCFLFISTAILYVLFTGARRAKMNGIGILQKGWTISMVGLIISACTAHLWNALFVYSFFLLGAGAWFSAGVSHEGRSHENNIYT